MIGQAGVTQVNPINPYVPYRYVDPQGTAYELGYYSYMQLDQGYFPFTATDPSSGYTYNFNPAGIQAVTGGLPYALSQVSNNNPVMSLYSYGFSYNSNNGISTLVGPSNIYFGCSRSAIVQLICNNSIIIPIFTAINENPKCVYNFNFTMNCGLAASTPYLRYILSSSGEPLLTLYPYIIISDVY